LGRHLPIVATLGGGLSARSRAASRLSRQGLKPTLFHRGSTKEPACQAGVSNGVKNAPRMQASPACNEGVVLLIVYYVAFMIVGDLAAYLIGLVAEREWGSQVSLIAFLSLYFLFLWVSWILAVWITDPRRAIKAAL
jgi:hypothetical protein